MHYCQSCPEPTAMEPDGEVARCPSCGRTDQADRRPVFMITGASGSGKTTVFAPLASMLARRCVVFDVDWLLDPAQALSGAKTLAELPWDSFWDAWFSVAHGVAQSGLPAALLGPSMSGRLDEFPVRKWIGEIYWFLLDCSDDAPRARIQARPRWRSRDIDQQIDFGRWLRDNITDQVDTTAMSPEETVRAVSDRVMDRLGLDDVI
jgi:hypothetical protein